MNVTSVCLLLSATLNIHPNRSQFFWYDAITLTCEMGENSGNWTLKRKAPRMSEPCSLHRGTSYMSSCTIENAYPSDSGIYWCESEKGECSNNISVTITEGDVILESPAFPVTEGDKITLRCHYKEQENRKATSNFSANFYKDGTFIGTYPAENMTLSAVSTSDEGFYKCEHPAKGKSPQSWMTVRSKGGPRPSQMSLPKLACIILTVVLHTVMLTVSIKVYRLWAEAQAEAKRTSDLMSQT